MKKTQAIRGLQPRTLGLFRTPEAEEAARRAVEAIRVELQRKAPPPRESPSLEQEDLMRRLSKIADQYFVDVANDGAIRWPEIVNQTRPLAEAAAAFEKALNGTPQPVKNALIRQRNFSSHHPLNSYSLSNLQVELSDLLDRCKGILDPVDEEDMPFQPHRQVERGPPPRAALTRLVKKLTSLRLELYGEPFSGSTYLVGKPPNEAFAQDGPHFVMQVARCIDTTISPGSVRSALKAQSSSS